MLNKIKHAKAGFTLLEMLVVVSILAAIAFIASGTYTGFIEDSQEQLVYSEMQEIASAIRQFKQDTGYYPKEGPFERISGSACPSTFTSAGVDPTTVGSSSNFASAANMEQLLEQPDICSGHPLSQLDDWESETGRGWRGPYLSGVRDGVVDVAANNSDPTDTTASVVNDVTAIADPFIATPMSGGLMEWDRETGDGAIDKWGRPYLFLQIAGEWSLISMGPDGDFDDSTSSSNNDNIVITFE